MLKEVDRLFRILHDISISGLGWRASKWSGNGQSSRGLQDEQVWLGDEVHV